MKDDCIAAHKYSSNHNAELPLADLTLTWQFEWNDVRGRPYGIGN
ncbi:hypothetical protein [Desulfosporosinus nitroreducens]|nr:hypothetical protein [Desulfosporosinus nitroreducens]